MAIGDKLIELNGTASVESFASVAWPSGKAEACKASIPQFESGCHLIMLYLIATPIGNLEDITLRALATLKECDYILAEDTRHSYTLLQHHGIDRPLVSFHQHNEKEREDKVLDDLRQGKKIALISDAGTPLISDPGFLLVKACRTHGLAVTALPGASSVLVALSLAGLEPTPFQFIGFLPRKRGELIERLEAILDYASTTIAYESAERLEETLKVLVELAPECTVAIARELTKKFEHIRQGTAQEVYALQKNEPARGEIVLLIHNKHEQESAALFSKELLQSLVADAAKNCSTKEAITLVANQLKLPKRTVYNAVHA